MIQLTGAAKHFGPKILFENFDWLVTPNERAGIVGANGTGKSTLLKILAGMDSLDAGTIVTMKGASVGYLPQDGLSLSGRTVFAECMTVFADLLALEQEQETLAHKMSELDPASPEYAQVADRFHQAEGEFRARDGYAIEAQVGTVLSGLGFPQREWTKRTEEFSGGWQMRIALAKLLLEKPNLLLLDEPTNHLDLEARNWLEGYLESYPHAFVLVSHDRYFLDVTVRKSLEIWNKRVHFYTGGYSRYEQQKAERLAQLEAAYANQQDRITQLEAFINRFRYQATKAKQVQSRIKELEHIERIEVPPEEKTIHFRFPQPKPSGRIVAEFKNVAKSYGDTAVFAGVNFIIERGDRVALVGVNGAGKSTLIKILAGAEPLTSGEYILGHNAQPDYFAQDQYKELDVNARLIDDLGERRAARHQHRTAVDSGLLPVLRRRCVQDDRRALGRRAQSLRAGPHADDAVEFPAARRAHQPPGPARQRRAADRAAGIHRHGGVRLARPLLHRQAGHARLRSRRRSRASLPRQLRRLLWRSSRTGLPACPEPEPEPNPQNTTPQRVSAAPDHQPPAAQPRRRR